MTNQTPLSDDIPPRVPLEQLPPIRTDRDLHHYWRMMMGPLGFTRRRLWLSFTERDGRILPALPQIDDVPGRAGHADAEALMDLLGHFDDLYAHGGAVAILYSRPGRHPMDTDDRSWARELTAAAQEQGIPLWPVHFANDEVLRVFAPDDLTVSPGGMAPRTPQR